MEDHSIVRGSLQNELRPVTYNLAVLFAWAPFLPSASSRGDIQGCLPCHGNLHCFMG